MKLFVRTLLAAAIFAAAPIASQCGAETIRIAVQKTGTLAWELAVIRAHGLDKQANLSIKVIELASPEAGKIALRGGSADIIVSDWLWVSRERGLGAKLTFYPYSSALGAVMVPTSSPIRTLADLKGRKLAYRRRPARQKLAAATGVNEAGRHRPEVGSRRSSTARHRCWRRRCSAAKWTLPSISGTSAPHWKRRATVVSPVSKTFCRSLGPRAARQ